jgi:hypothetical protein
VSTNVYEEILDMIQEAQLDSREKEVDRVQQELAAEKRRADNMESAMEDNKSVFKKELVDERRGAVSEAQSSRKIQEELQETLSKEKSQHDVTYTQLFTPKTSGARNRVEPTRRPQIWRTARICMRNFAMSWRRSRTC